MTQYGWATAPATVRDQVNGFTAGVADALGDNLIGVYLHGSLAMGCFNSACSDIDLLIVTRESLSEMAWLALAETTLRYAEQPHPLELSALPLSALHPWQYPTPFDFHYGDDWRERIARCLTGGVRDTTLYGTAADPDLAAHVMVTRHRGICLTGQSIPDVFPDVPRADYLDSLLKDFDFARAQLAENPVYAVLNYCRIYGYVLEGRMDSKDEAGEWAVRQLPAYAPLIRHALAMYRGENIEMDVAMGVLNGFADEIYQEIQNYIA